MQVDIFSLGIIMYELFNMNLTANVASFGEDADLPAYAEKVAHGHREPLTKGWPAELKVRICLLHKPCTVYDCTVFWEAASSCLVGCQACVQ